MNLEATCFRTEWRARANFRRLILRDSPSSQQPRLPKFNFGTASSSPTSVPPTVYLPESRFCHTSCTLGFKCIFKLVDFLSSGMETPCNLCQIKTEIICVQHAPKGTCTAKRSEAAPFAQTTSGLPAGYPRVDSYQKLYDQFFKKSRIR